MTENKKPLIILTGPTAVGKTALSIQLAKAIGGEITLDMLLVFGSIFMHLVYPFAENGFLQRQSFVETGFGRNDRLSL